MIGSFCTTLLLHFSKRFSTANIHFSIKIALIILHFFYLPVSTFSTAAARSNFFGSSTATTFFRRQPVLQQLYFITVFIYTPNKVKSEQREEKKQLRQTNQPIYPSPHTIQSIFSFGCKIFVTASCFQLTSVGENPAYFHTFASEENRWTSDGKREFSRWF